jgi:hypothetical protein
MTLMNRLRARRAAPPRGITFCDTCGQVCDATCRSNAIRDRVRTTVLAMGPR